ncbi:hypothetical protein Tco_1457428 [Tanacetum coccineum]
MTPCLYPLIMSLVGPAAIDDSRVFPSRRSSKDGVQVVKSEGKEFNIVAYTQRFNELALMCPRMVDPKNVKVDSYIQGLSDNIKGEVTSSKPTNVSEAVRMAHKLMEQKLQAKKERDIEGNRRKWENF